MKNINSNPLRIRSDSSPLRSAFLELWHEYITYNADDIDGGEVVAQGQTSGHYYIVTLDDGRVKDADIYF